jgi:hypothetical protein
MSWPTGIRLLTKHRLFAILAASFIVLGGWHFYVYGQNKSDFPEGYDAVQAAPDTHKVIFENSFVRVLEVTVPEKGGKVPMHHHRWPSFFLSWDTGGATPHIRYHRPDGSVRDTPSKDYPLHPGIWDVRWMNPEPMHEIEVVDKPKNDMPANSPTDLRIEIKCHP